ncbi:hypothetical protein E2562_035959 [Oryza meyeriana var. granulata]|uniref:Cytosol aminopeptidase domain-containing protein n=1 Tax=Oryza meyeriana var. granulata TaxID=110450 RepID=A0A6G1F1U2_9ORYZ|nr:hypothetical protein E2562_035959 [Oryza meyeriana var. granulata]KAF0930860.1 hypothetical protein E2562_035959 [Oryza meyeriana var. granulata]
MATFLQCVFSQLCAMGGYNIMVGAVYAIGLTKKDMGGSIAVFGAAKALDQIKPPVVEVHFISAAFDNLVSGIGMSPGDIVTDSNGKTIEVCFSKKLKTQEYLSIHEA